MPESAVELLGGLCLSAPVLLIGLCIVGSIVAALRAVSRGSHLLVSEGEQDLRQTLEEIHHG
jgi:hypothetical protein